MPEISIKAAALLGIESDDSNTSLRIRFRDPQNTLYAIDIHEGVIPGLIVALMGSIAQLQGGGPMQPMNLTAGRVFTIADGRAGLELQLENAIRLPVLFPREGIPALRRTLDELERLSRQAPAGRPAN